MLAWQDTGENRTVLRLATRRPPTPAKSDDHETNEYCHSHTEGASDQNGLGPAGPRVVAEQPEPVDGGSEGHHPDGHSNAGDKAQ